MDALEREMIVVLISAQAEWNVVRETHPEIAVQRSPFGEWGEVDLPRSGMKSRSVFFHGGWGKVKAAASAQFAIDRFSPTLVVNIGTCGGFAGDVSVGDILLVEKTVIYDIHERMFDPEDAVAEHSTSPDLDWVDRLPPNVKRATLASADTDLSPDEIAALRTEYGAIAGDWESGAIAHVCGLNRAPCLILRGVSDLVSEVRGEAYENPEVFLSGTRRIMEELVASLPDWIDTYHRNRSTETKEVSRS